MTVPLSNSNATATRRCDARRDIAFLICLSIVLPAVADDRPLDFVREIQPILAEHCFACHGPDAQARQAGLRLDQADAARRALESGATAIVPHRPADSELIRRIESPDEATRMPPPGTGKRLTAAEQRLLRRWIADGGVSTGHWAYLAPRRPPLPQVHRKDWVRTPVDLFVLSRLEAEGLSPAAEAERPTLLRRLSLDLTGNAVKHFQAVEFRWSC